MDLDAAIRYRAKRQLGLVTRAGLLQRGTSSSAIDRRLDSGLLVRVLPGIYLMDGFRFSIEAKALAATLWAGRGAVASHRCCARLFRFDDAPDVVEISSTARKSGIPGWIVLHRPRSLPRVDVTRIGPIPITTPTRMLLDSGAVIDEELLEVWLDQALRERKTSVHRLQRCLARAGGHRKHGAARLRRLLAERDPSAAPNESRLETRLARLLRRAGLRHVEPQRILYDDGGFIGRIDFVFPERRLVVEAHSYKYHSSHRAWANDVARWNRLRRDGWRIVLVTWRDVVNDPDGVVSDIQAELAKDQLF